MTDISNDRGRLERPVLTRQSSENPSPYAEWTWKTLPVIPGVLGGVDRVGSWLNKPDVLVSIEKLPERDSSSIL